MTTFNTVFIGVFFSNEHDALLCVRAALAMQEQCPVRLAIGVSSGHVFCGEIGSADRCDYVIVGDVVNTLDRYCAENKLDPQRQFFWICCLCEPAPSEDRTCTGVCRPVR